MTRHRNGATPHHAQPIGKDVASSVREFGGWRRRPPVPTYSAAWVVILQAQ
jgi:hypothetical protein